MKGGFGWLRNVGRDWTPVIIAVLLIRSFVVEAYMVPSGSMLNTILIGDFMLVNKFVYGVKLPFTDKTIIPVSSPKRGDIIVFRFPVDADDPQPQELYKRLFPRWLPLLPLFWDNQMRFFTWYVPRNFIKRCVAVAGDTVECRNKQLYVNGRLQTEPYVMHTDAQTLPGFDTMPPQAAFQKAWEDRRFYESDYSAYVRDQFGPVIVPAGYIFVMGDNRDNSEDGRFWGPLDLRYLRGKPLVIYFSSDAAPNIARMIISPWAIRFNRIGHIVR